MLSKISKVEPKLPIVNTLLTAIFLILPNVISQYLDGRIKNYDGHVRNHFNEMFLKEIKRSEYLQAATYQQERINHFEDSVALSKLASRLRLEMRVDKDAIMQGDETERQLFEKYSNKEISPEEYLSKMGDLARKEKKRYSFLVDQHSSELKKLQLNPPVEPTIVRRCKNLLGTIQLFGASLLVLINSKFVRTGK